MVRTAAVYSFPAALIAIVVAAAGRPAGGGPRLAGGSSRSRSRLRWRPRLRCGSPSACRRHSPPSGLRSTARARRQARLLRAGRRAVRGRHERLLQRRRAVLRARAGEDARRRRHRDLRLLPRARPRDCGATSARSRFWPWCPGRAGRQPCIRRGASSYGAVILAGALWVLAGLRSTQPVTALTRRRGARSRRGRGVDLGGGREGRRPPLGALGPEQLIRRRDLGQLCLGRAVRRDPVLEEGANRHPDHRVRSVGSTGGQRRSISSTRTAGSTTPLRWRPALQPEGCRTTRCCRHARSTEAPG